MDKKEDSLYGVVEYLKTYTSIAIALSAPLPLFLFLGLNKILVGPILLILILCYYISLIPFAIFYLHYRDKRESQNRLKMREMEDKVFRRNLRK
jgi:hypothetical protein